MHHLPPLESILSFLKTTTGLIVAATTLLGAVLAFFKSARETVMGALGAVKDWLPKKNVHRVELRIVPDYGACQWQEVFEEWEPAMLVHCKLFLTNVAPVRTFQILDTYIKKPFTRGGILPKHIDSEVPAPAPGDARLAGEFIARFKVFPAVCKAGKHFVCDVVLVDQFGGKHVAENVTFTSVGGPAWEMQRKELEKQEHARRQNAMIQVSEKIIKDSMKKKF
jgi:hypothetical protein